MSSLGVPPFSHWMGFCVVVDVVLDVETTGVVVDVVTTGVVVDVVVGVVDTGVGDSVDVIVVGVGDDVDIVDVAVVDVEIGVVFQSSIFRA